MAQLTANLILTEHLTVRVSLKGRIEHGSASSLPSCWSRWFLPGRRPFPDVTHEALERLRAVLERAHATVPITIV